MSNISKIEIEATKYNIAPAVGKITLTGDVTGEASFNGTDTVDITATVIDDSHNHTIENIDELQTNLNSKYSLLAGTSIPANSDLNNYRTVGNYHSPDSTTSASLSNTPITTSGFALKVSSVYSENSTILSTYACQEAISNGNVRWIRWANTDGEWQTWRRVFDSATVLPITNGLKIGGASLTYDDEEGSLILSFG